MPPPLLPDKIEDELEMTMVCHRPEGLEQLEAQTNFTKRELQVLYRGFKNVRPPPRGSGPGVISRRAKLFWCRWSPLCAKVQGGHHYEPAPGKKENL